LRAGKWGRGKKGTKVLPLLSTRAIQIIETKNIYILSKSNFFIFYIFYLLINFIENGTGGKIN
jgi:hypothetical protein